MYSPLLWVRRDKKLVGQMTLGASIVASCFLGMGAQAEDGVRGLEEVVVSARRVEESLQETPLSIVAVSGEDLQDMGIANLDTLDAFIPNLSTGTGMGNSGWASFAIRGIGGGQGWIYQESGVGVYIDDIYYPRANGALLDVIDVEQIEILRGPQGTLFGRNTTGGAIRYVSAKPGDEFSGKVTGVIGSKQRRDVSAAVNIPLTDTLATRVTFASKSRDGFVKQLNTGRYAGDTNVDAARIQLRWQPNDRLDWNVSFDVLETENAGVARNIPVLDPRDAFAAGVPPFVPYETRTPNPDLSPSLVTGSRYSVAGGSQPDFNSTESFGITSTIEYELSDNLILKSITGYRDNEAINDSDWDLTEVDVWRTQSTTTFDNISQEFQLSGNAFENRLDYVVGAFYMNETAFYDAFRSTGTIPPLNGPRTYDIDTTSIAAFGQGSYDITDSWRATVGIRWSKDDKELKSTQGGVGSASDSWSSTTTRFGMDYKITDDFMVYASYAEGFKAGGFNNSNAVNLRPYDPENVESYEIGLRSEFFDNRVRLNLTYFTTDYTDIQISDIVFLPDATQLTSNAGSAEMDGIELEGTFLVTESLTLRLSAGWIDAKYTDVGNSPNLTLDTPIQRTPEFAYTIGGTYDTPLPSGANLAFNMDYGWKDEQTNNDSATNGFFLPDYGLLNARIAYTSADDVWGVALVATNLTDEEYLVGGFDPSTREHVFGFVHHDLGRPREFGVEVSARF